MPLPRSMTAQEQRTYLDWFPVLDVTLAVVTGEIDSHYNCIAWTINCTSNPVWLTPATVDAYDTFYGQLGYTNVTIGEIALLGTSEVEVVHGMVSGPAHGPRWESKNGTDLRFQHGLHELDYSCYGHIVAQYHKTGSPHERFARHLERIMHQIHPATYLTPEQHAVLTTLIQGVPQQVRDDYKTAFTSWKASWFRGSLRILSNPALRRVGPEFDALIALGPKILPLVLASLADPENYFALQLYDCIQPRPDLIVTFKPDDERVLEGEPGRARRTLDAWFRNG